MSLGRPKQFDPAAALDAAMQQFWAHGYEATSLQQLLKVTRLSKSSFYQTFGSKQQLFVACLAHYRHASLQAMQAWRQEHPDALALLEKILLSTADDAERNEGPRGCLLMNSAVEFAQHDAGLSRLVRGHLDRLRAFFEEAITAGQQAGDIRADKSAADLAGFIVMSMGGLRTQVKAGADRREVGTLVALVLERLK